MGNPFIRNEKFFIIIVEIFIIYFKLRSRSYKKENIVVGALIKKTKV